MLKTSLRLILVPLLTSCATAIPYTDRETCAFQGMKPIGASITEGSAVGYTSNGHMITMDTSARSVSCMMTQDPLEQCQIHALQESAQPKVYYNDTIGMKKTMNGIGYLFFVAPGLLMKVAFDKNAKDASNKSEKLLEWNLGKCPQAEASSSSAR